MTTEQWMAMLRQALPLLGGIAITLGWLTADQVSKGIEITLAIAGPVLTLAGIGWALWANTKTSLLTKTAQLPEVKSIEIAPTERTIEADQEATRLVSATPPNVVRAFGV